MFICIERINFISNFFFKILIIKILQTCYLGDFGNAWPSPSKIIVSICRKLSCLYACHKSTSSLTFFLRYCKEKANLLFWVIWVCLATPKVIGSIWRNLWCLSTSKKPTSFFLFSLRYCKDIANLLFWVLWASLLTHPKWY